MTKVLEFGMLMMKFLLLQIGRQIANKHFAAELFSCLFYWEMRYLKLGDKVD